MNTDPTNRPRSVAESAETACPMSTWEQEIDEQRSAIGDDTPIVAAAWLNLDNSGEPSAGPAVLWRQDNQREGLKAFLRRRFDSWHGRVEGAPFVVWTERFVYFPVQCEGAEWVGAVPLVPTADFKPLHFG